MSETKIYRAHKIALDLTDEEKIYFRKASGCARLAYNWALAEWKKQYDAGEKPSAQKLSKKFNSIKRQEFPFVTEVAAKVCEVAINDLGDAFDRFFKKLAAYPTFKVKGKSKDSFKLDYRAIRPEAKSFFIEKLGRVKSFEELRFDGKVLNTTFSRQADRWFVSIAVEIDEENFSSEEITANEKVGVDLGIKAIAVLSNGEVFENPKAYRNQMKKLAKLQRLAARKQKGSSNQKKANEKVAKTHARISNIRANSIHELTTSLTRRFKEINIEDLNVAGMKKNRKLALSISDASFGEIRRQLVYKAETIGSKVNIVDRFYPSSKTCSSCGKIKKDLTLSDRTFKCECGFEMDRDLNAAINIKNWN